MGKEFFCHEQINSVDETAKVCFLTGMSTQATADSPPRSLPEIPLNELSETTKDFLLAHSSSGKSVPAVIVELLDAAAEKSGRRRRAEQSAVADA